MIYCVRFDHVVEALRQIGFVEISRTGATRLFGGPADRRLLIRAPNVDGAIPETIVDSAFDAAGLVPPAWDVFWCD